MGKGRDRATHLSCDEKGAALGEGKEGWEPTG